MNPVMPPVLAGTTLGAIVERMKRLLRDRAFLSTVALVVVAFAAAFLSMLAVSHLEVVKSLDNSVQDEEVAAYAPAQRQDRDIVVITIDETTVQKFPYRSPVDRAFLASVLSSLASRHPRAIGLDVFFDQPTEPAKDELLRRTLASLRVPLVVAYPAAPLPSDFTPEQLAYLDTFVPWRLRADVRLPEDQYGTVRTIFPGVPDQQGRYVNGFARALASTAGVHTPAKEYPIVWRGKPPDDGHGNPAQERPFPEYSAQLASLPLPGGLPEKWIAGKIVLIGAKLSLREDRHRTPFAAVMPGGGGMLPGIVIQAHALAQLLEGRRSPNVDWRTDLLIAFACAMIGGILGLLHSHILTRVFAALIGLLAFWFGGVALFHFSGTMIGLLTPSLAFVGCFSVMDSLSGRDARLQRQFIQGAFSRYVSPKVVEELIRDPAKMALKGERREMSYLFTDIENFTTLSEGLDSQELALLLNAYFDGATQIVLRHGGMVDKFIGDSVFAIFNAPVDIPDHAACAVRCALEIDDFSESFRRQQSERKIAVGLTRIGVHTGSAVIGNFGSSARFNYTAQGDAVNIASRLEALNKHLGTRICVSGETRDACSNIAFRPMGSVVLKGKTTPVEVFEPLHDGVEADDYFERYRAAYAELRHGAPDAISLFEKLNAENPDDACVCLHLNRLRRGESGVLVVMGEK
jgi:class 3 adenylate cyclase/CHASE2 domain-containing sensor protein